MEGGLLPAVSQSVSFNPPEVSEDTGLSAYRSPRNTLLSTSGVVVAVGDQPTAAAASASQNGGPVLTSTGLAFDEEAKLVYGVILSLRNMVKKLSGRCVICHVLFNMLLIFEHLAETRAL